MESEEISPSYSVFYKEGKFVINGKEKSSGKEVSFAVFAEEKTVLEFAEILNRNKVSVHHAKDVVRDMLLAQIRE